MVLNTVESFVERPQAQLSRDVKRTLRMERRAETRSYTNILISLVINEWGIVLGVCWTYY